MRYKKLYPAVICFCVFLAAIGLVLGDPSTVLPGLWKIIVTEDALITDYVKIAGVSAALVNSALVTLVSLLLLYLSKEPPNGFTLVELGLMAGFSLFGKNIVNIWPIIAGTFLYAKARREPFGKYVSVSLLATAPGPGGELCGAGQRLRQPVVGYRRGTAHRLCAAAPLRLYIQNPERHEPLQHGFRLRPAGHDPGTRYELHGGQSHRGPPLGGGL